MSFEEYLPPPPLSDYHQRCYCIVASLWRHLARYHKYGRNENESESCLISHLIISNSVQQSGYLWPVTYCPQEHDSDGEGFRGVAHKGKKCVNRYRDKKVFANHLCDKKVCGNYFCDKKGVRESFLRQKSVRRSFLQQKRCDQVDFSTKYLKTFWKLSA